MLKNEQKKGTDTTIDSSSHLPLDSAFHFLPKAW